MAGARHSRRRRDAALAGACLLLTVGGAARAQDERASSATRPEAALVADAAKERVNWFLGGSGRFEVLAREGEEGRELAAVTERAWPVFAETLGLPDRLPAAITVRLAPRDEWGFAEPDWRVAAEPTGVVTVWIRGGRRPGLDRERLWLVALADGSLRRLAYWSGAGAAGPCPAWLPLGAAEEALARGQPALMDAWQQAASRRTGGLLPLRELLFAPGGRGAAPDETMCLAARGLWLWLRAESGRGPGWGRLVEGTVGGVSPGLALVKAYPDQFAKAGSEDLELAWQTAAAGLARMRTGPVWGAEESRRWLLEADRLIVSADGEDGAEKLCEVWTERNDACVLQARENALHRLNQVYGALHPFYRNAAGSLGRVLLAQRERDRRAWLRALNEWREDMATGRALELASAEVLDEAEKARGGS